MIEPTVGRNVHYYQNKHQYEEGMQPFHANILYVHNDRMINVAGWNHNGTSYSSSSCPLLQDDDPIPELGYFAVWMPYQKATAVVKAEVDGTDATTA